MNTQFTQAPKPKINAVFEIEGPVIASIIEAPIKRVDQQDDGSFTVVIDYWPTSEASQVVENIEDHIAYSCQCGSVNFALLKSGGIECNKCGEKLNDSKWSGSSKALEPMTDERIDELADTALTDYREGRNNDHVCAFARAVEAFHGIGGTPKALEPLTDERKYKLLDCGDEIQKGDTVLDDDTTTWHPLAGWEVGMKWGYNLMPMRRAVEAAHGITKATP